ncbi:MAG: type II toxin-antitoxin system HicB family antitoxin [Oscillospiraceae bacterium]|jgi:predicted RNase H-like HicB family nuclease|nr:type II toxin-antitoxin system HicB family antitoxin [Oscillospiraceae bacterium]
MKYVYPAIFEREETGIYAINFPDVDGCYTSGQDMLDGHKMAEDVLSFCLFDLERENKPAPNPSLPSAFQTSANGFVALIACDTDKYRKLKNKTVKKTLTLPDWLNAEAEAANVNFSGILQDALKQKLNIA